MTIVTRNTKQTSWREQVRQLQDLRKELDQSEAIMTQYEKQVNGQEIRNLSELYFPTIAEGARRQYEAARTRYQAAEAGIRKAEAAEANRWDAAKYKAEYEAIRLQVDQALGAKSDPLAIKKPAAARIEKIYKDAMQDDGAIPYRKRAAAEILQDVNPAVLPRDQQVKVAIVASQARQELEALRVTPELVKANKQADDAWDGLKLAHVEVVEAIRATGSGDPSHPMFGQASPLGNLLRTVQVQDGKVVFLDENSPEVTGLGEVVIKG